ncbi:LamG domain-containing protein [Streptomyces sp. NBC_00247]|uniref:LamG domain-containing protein n=1 Tax=Streptomyces sp. NBC_00247 TaxID=2975689 RepID=UPI002E27E909|nr:LamG domain-containing protein [Streptomyces sp. NBC_00247]
MDNLPPLQPGAADLETGSKPCVSGADRPVVTWAPALHAVLNDPAEDNAPGRDDTVNAEFEVWWTDPDGVEQRLRDVASPYLPSGSTFSWDTSFDGPLPADTVISWHVRAHDGTAVSEWSDEGTSACEFVIDTVAPQAPVVTSAEFPENVFRSGGVGTYGTFRFSSPVDDDVVSYRYTLLGYPGVHVAATGPEHTAEVRLLATDSNQRLEVEAFDKAGHGSGTTNYNFYPSFASAPVAEWQLADVAGTRSAAAVSGTAARAGTGAVFGAPAPEGTALTSTVSLDGTGHGFLTPGAPVVDTTKTFAVGGWVRPGATDRTMTVASQDADGAPAFTLGLRPGDDGAQWSFGAGAHRVTGGTPEADSWSYVLGLYDAETGLAHLYVNGKETGIPAAIDPARVTGAFQIGRARGKAGYRDRWQGEIGDLRAWDRVVVPAEITQLALVEVVRATETARWSMETGTEGKTPSSVGADQPLSLEGGAHLYRWPSPDDWCDLYPECFPDKDPLRGYADLALDGVDDYAATAQPVVDTARSYTVAAVVMLDHVTADDAAMTLFSQGNDDGTAAFEVRYVPATQQWELRVSHAGTPEAEVTTVSAAAPPGGLHRVGVVHDTVNGRVALYVDAQETGASVAFRSGWTSTGGLQIGRGPVQGGWGSYLRGSVDDIHVFDGALPGLEVRDLGFG